MDGINALLKATSRRKNRFRSCVLQNIPNKSLTQLSAQSVKNRSWKTLKLFFQYENTLTQNLTRTSNPQPLGLHMILKPRKENSKIVTTRNKFFIFGKNEIFQVIEIEHNFFRKIKMLIKWF